MEKYERTECLGQGTFGKVFKAINLETGEVVALKKNIIKDDDEGVPPTTLREVSILLSLNHPHIVKLQEVIHRESKEGTMARPTLMLVFEFLDHDLKQYMVAKQGKGKGLPLDVAKSFCYQILLGLRHCHAHSVMHRDLKPQNILVSGDDTVKLADFGLGRVFSLPVGKYTHEVVTLWYRAPEVLLGTRCYSTGVDVWSVGCILAEMVLGKPIFYGESELEQLLSIFRIMGTPSTTTWPTVQDLRDWHDYPQWKERSLAEVVPQLGAPGCDLLRKMLQLNPAQRISASAALNHEFFRDVNYPLGSSAENSMSTSNY
mmetsp:Transcript_4385/g.18660  ORF Transcript_4385/g.18660 Transcript_4385/m.18660 type:complete len:316 (-) Transcript_4385:1474-2421(-)|eukprot:CAMPEP_0113968544 /NCGR_PEP_ID=MMETSP0011_2-20120614/9611_1 /TAXON_ID=101924 /ORGANISM="Rhodosorus marinus" /LENGTH=315 /DNA_ID=CAMNT_0000981683 /DNA_START=92 /DNA_END=1042 /DNA_ORIENTATION=- /assembly_acc=CAM_ASM_000156